MNKIVAVRHGENGSISEYKLDNGTVISREEAVSMANKGQLEGVSSFTTRDGDMSVRSDRGQYNYSLEDLPTF